MTNEHRNTQYLGEIKEDGIIYTLALRKVYCDVDENSENRLLWTSELEKTVQYGNVSSLIDHLLTNSDNGSYKMCFLSVYRIFISPSDLMKYIIDRYKEITSKELELAPKLTLKSLISFIKLWLEKFLYDFIGEISFTQLNELEQFLEQEAVNASELIAELTQLRRQLFHYRQRIVTSLNKQQIFCEKCCHPRCDGRDKIYSWLDIPPNKVAQDLTALDAEIFCNVICSQCLHYVRQDKSQANTVLQAINTFNKLVGLTVYTILHASNVCGIRNSIVRGQAISHWIDVAQSCRVFKNFSSLKAIVSGLDSSSVYRLKRSWENVSNEKKGILKELHHLLSYESNFQVFRNVLDKEATGKSAQTKKHNNLDVIHGVVPYLGTILTDLTMLHTAIPDLNEEGLINFEKHRKEFEILAKLSLYQTSANKYMLPLNISLVHCLYSATVLSEDDCFKLSNEIEPEHVSPQVSPYRLSAQPCGVHLLRQSLQLFTKVAISDIDTKLPDQFSSSEEEIISSSSSSISSQPDTTKMSRSSSCPVTVHDSVIVRIALCDSNACSYKSIMVSKSDHGTDVIKRSLEKYNIINNTDTYSIYQLLGNGKEVHIPLDAAVYYAILKDNNVPTLLLKL